MTWTWQSKKPGSTRLAGAVDGLVAVEAGADVHDAPVLDHHVGAAGSAPVPSNTEPPCNTTRVMTGPYVEPPRHPSDL